MLTVLSVAYTLAPVSPDAVGGAEQVLSALDEALVRAGHHSVVVACLGSEVSGQLVPMLPAPRSCVDTAGRLQAQAVARDAVWQAVHRERPDLVHMHGVDFDACLPPPGPPTLVTLHLPPAWYCADALAPSRPNTWLHGVSATQQSACPEHGAFLPPIGNGVPVDRLARNRHGRRNYALMLARICPEKGVHLALDAAKAAGVALLIGGAVFPYPEHRAYFAAAVAPRLDRHRRFLGPLDFARKRRLLTAARCLLAPSLAPETSSLVAMEALACGTPVIAFRAGALCEIIEHGRTGFLVSNATEMAAAMHQVSMIDPETCRATARARFSRASMVAAYLDRYHVMAAHGTA